MTTQVTISAAHGWPVLVRPLSTNGKPIGPARTVEPNATETFHVFEGQDLLIHEVQPGRTIGVTDEPILQFFAFDHLPPQLRAVSEPFAHMAERIVATLPRNPERSVALRKLLEAKDAAVRAGLFV